MYTKINEAYHQGTKIQKKVISKSNFTYRNTIRILEKFHLRGKRVLDLGCGVGTIDFYLSSHVKSIDAIDDSRKAIDFAIKSSNYMHKKNVHFTCADISKITFKRKYDIVLLFEVLEHLEKDELIIKKIYKCLEKDGLLFISVPLKSAPLARFKLIENFDQRVGHLRRYSIENVRNLLKKNGFRVLYEEETEGIIRNFLFTNTIANLSVRFIKGFLSELVTILDNSTLNIFGKSQLLMVSQKQ